MNKVKQYDNFIGMLSISVVGIIATVFVIMVSNTQVAKGTYGAQIFDCSMYTDQAECNSLTGVCKWQGGTCVNADQTTSTTTKTTTKKYQCICWACIKGSDNKYGWVQYEGGNSYTETAAQCKSSCSSSQFKWAYGFNNIGYPSAECSGDSTEPSQEEPTESDTIICNSGQYYDGSKCAECNNISSNCNCPGVTVKKGSTTRTGIVCSGSPSTPDTPSTPSTPDTPTTDTGKCYVKDHEYVWATTQPTGSGLVSSITTADKCKGCETGYAKDSNNKCVATSTGKCYVKDHEYVWATTQPTGSGLVSSITTADKCKGCETGYAMNSSNKCVATATGKCYVKDHEYVWATTQPTGSGLVSSITTADKCRGCETGYAMNSSNKCVKPDSSPNGGNGSGGESNSESNDSNPQTGASSVIFVWMIGLMAIGYSVWYFKRSTNN